MIVFSVKPMVSIFVLFNNTCTQRDFYNGFLLRIRMKDSYYRTLINIFICNINIVSINVVDIFGRIHLQKYICKNIQKLYLHLNSILNNSSITHYLLKIINKFKFKFRTKLTLNANFILNLP